MKTIGVVTGARSDYGIYLPILRKIQKDPDLQLYLFVTGMHLSPEFGLTASVIEHDGFEITSKIEMLLSADTQEGIAKSMGLGMIGFSQAYTQFRPDILLVLGDRFEMLAAVAAALPCKIPIAHIHGGESTEGSIDESIRHSITKMSHLHFASTEYYSRRIIQMGEEPWRVVVSGAPGLDNLNHFNLLSENEIQQRFGITLDAPALLVTYHPVTLDDTGAREHLTELLAALQESGFGIIFTYPNADAQGRIVIEMLETFAAGFPKAQIAVNLGMEGYFSLMSHACAMVGNSSSGIIEAASFNLPVVDIGDRQRGRLHGANIIRTGYQRKDILEAIAKATSKSFKTSLAGLENPYGDGHATTRIVAKIKEVKLDTNLIMKRFHSLKGGN